MTAQDIELAAPDLSIDQPRWSPGSRGLVFLSHTSRIRAAEELGNGDTLKRHEYRKKYLGQLLTELNEQLTEAGFSVWVDRQDLGAGEGIDPVIYAALGRCRGAIVLVDRDALDAEYLRTEVNILQFRRTVDEIPVLPVLLGDLTRGDLLESTLGRQTGIATVGLVQPSNPKPNGRAAHSTAAEVVAAMEDAAKDWRHPNKSQTARWIDDVALYLSGASENALLRAAEKLGLNLNGFHRTRRKPEAIAAALLTCGPAIAFAVLEDLVYQLDSFPQKKTVQLALPLWVDLHAARKTRAVGGGEQRRRLVGLPTRALRLGEHLARRATAGAPQVQVLRLPDVFGEEPVGELVESVARTLCGKLNISPGTTADEYAESRQGRGDVYVVMRCDSMSPHTAGAIIGALQLRFPGIIVVVLANPHHPIWRRPEITQAYESFTQSDEKAARKYVSDTNQLAGEAIEVDSDE